MGEVMSKHEIAKGGFSVEGVSDGASGIEVVISGPGGEREYTANQAASGKFAFTASEEGAHRVCFTNHATGGLRRVTFDFFSGVDAKDYADIAKKEHLLPIEVRPRAPAPQPPLAVRAAPRSPPSLASSPAPPPQLEMRKLEDRIDGVHREMLYQREREEAHRNTSESTNARVLWYSIATISVVIVVSVLQGMYLYRFLKAKKAI